jgi:hypothetical protein
LVMGSLRILSSKGRSCRSKTPSPFIQMCDRRWHFNQLRDKWLVLSPRLESCALCMLISHPSFFGLEYYAKLLSFYFILFTLFCETLFFTMYPRLA